MDHSKITPYKSDESKKDQVATMFNNIAGRYDFLNHFFSVGIDIIWRKKAIKLLKKCNPRHILDIATGTGDFAFEALKLNPAKITGVDISEGMMEIGREKIKKKGLQDLIEFKYGDSENLPFSDNSYDAVIVSFGVRNFENLNKGLKDMLRVLRPGGEVVILEFSQPKTFPIKQFYNFYSGSVMPAIGKIISRDKSAYTYLPESVKAFPEGDNFLNIMKALGYKETKLHSLSGGIASIYTGKK